MKAGTLRKAFRELMKDSSTAIAGHVVAFDISNQLAQLQIGILGEDRKGNQVKPEVIIECPVQFSGGGGWSVEHELKPGDEGIIIFSQRCLDAWIQTGGIAENPTARFHDKQDAFFIPGARSKPNVIQDFQNDGIRLRNTDASVYHWLKSDGTIESVNGSGYIKLLSSGVADINGFTIQPTGAAQSPVSVTSPTMTAITSLTVDGKEMKQHKHSDGTYVAGTTDVSGISGDPV